MRFMALAIAALSASLLAGCHPEKQDDAPARTEGAAPHTASAASHTAEASSYQAKVLSAKELKAHQDKHDLVIVDVRPVESFQREHIEGAINMPWAKLPLGYSQLPKDRFIALYCT